MNPGNWIAPRLGGGFESKEGLVGKMQIDPDETTDYAPTRKGITPIVCCAIRNSP